MANVYSKMVRNFDQLDLEKYERYLKLVAQLSRLFPDSDKPYIPYRFAERLYLHCYNGESVKDLSRRDNSFDALVVADKAGVLSELSSAFAAENVSLHSVIQKGVDLKNGNNVTLVLVTHECKEGNVQNVPSFLIFNRLMSIFIRTFAKVLFE